MPKTKSAPKDDKAAATQTSWIAAVVIAAIPVIGTILVAYFTYILPLRLSIQATQTAESRPTPTSTPTLLAPSATAPELAATATPTATSSPTALEPSSTPTIPIGGVKYCVDIAAVNVRNGPGLDYDIIGALPRYECLFFDGQFLFGDSYYWARISPNQAGFTQLANGWVYGGALRPQDFERLPPVTAPPLPYHTPTPAF
jgi:hypothetical protein